MITDTVILDDVWAEAPEEAEEAFLFIALSAHQRLKTLEADSAARGERDYGEWRKQYIYELSAVAEQLGVAGLPSAPDSVQNGNTMAQFDAALARVLTKIKTVNRAALKADSVALSYQTKGDIRKHLEELRAKINASNLSEAAKAALHKKVDAVELELDKNRASLRPIWLLAGALGLSTMGTIADAGGAADTISKIVKLVHEEKSAEAEQAQRFKPPLLEHNPALQITHQPDEPEIIA